MLSSSINDPNTGRRRVDYRAGKFKEGRLYGEGLQSIKRAVRRLCSHEYYIDIDIQNAGPCLFVQLLVKQGIEVPHLLQLYANDRNRVFEMIRQFLPDASDAQLKHDLLKLSHAGKPSQDGVPPLPILEAFRAQIHSVALQLKTKPRYAEMYKARLDAKESNPLGSFISCVWQEIENIVLMCLVAFFQLLGYMVGNLAFDGLTVDKHDNPDLKGLKTTFSRKLDIGSLS